MSMAFFSSPPRHVPSLSPPQSNAKVQLALKCSLCLKPGKTAPFVLVSTRATDDGAGAAVTVEEDKTLPATEEKVSETPLKLESLESNGSPLESSFQDPRWVNGTWDLKKFDKDGKTNWDAVIDAESKRRKWLGDNPESSSNDDPVVFDTSVIPWWAWTKRYHLPEAELLNGRAAMVGFFMAYVVDSLTRVGLVDQMSNFFCKTLLFVSVVGVLLIRKTEDIETVKKLLEDMTFYDKQWQATWQDENLSSFKKDQ